MIVIHGGVAIDSTRVDEVEEKAGPFQAASRAEAGCVEYQLSWKVGEVASLRLLEVWADEESYVAHTRAAHTAEWSAFVPGAQFGVRIPARAARSAAPRSVASNSSASASHDSTVTTPRHCRYQKQHPRARASLKRSQQPPGHPHNNKAIQANNPPRCSSSKRRASRSRQEPWIPGRANELS